MANVGVTFDFAAESAKLRTEIDRVRKELGKINATAKGIGDGFKALGGVIAGAFTVGAAVGFLKSVNSIADGLNDMAQKMGASASGLQALQVAAAQAGGTAEGLNTALGKMSSTLGDAMAGNKQAVASIDRLGLSINELSKMKADEAFRVIAQRISEIPNAYERAAAAQDIFGKGAKDIAGLLAEGGAAIDEVNRKLEEQGARLSDLDVAKIGVMNDELQFQSTVVQNLGTKFLSGLTPAIGVATGAVSDMLSKLGGATESGKLFGTVMVAGIKIVETAAYGLAATFETVRAVISGMLAIIGQGIADLLGGVAGIADKLGFDWAAKVQSAATTMDNVAGALQNVSDTARENAVQAASYAIEAATQIVKAGEIFATAEAEYQRKAAEAAARNAAGQGTGSGYQAADAAGKNKKPTMESALNAAAADPNAARMGQLANPYEFGTLQTQDPSALMKDPLTDPKYLYQQSLNAAMTQLASDNAAEQLSLQQALDVGMMDSLFLRNDMMLAAEQSKNMTMGDLMGELVTMGLQQGGAMGKFAKAYAIAQTVWSTGTAIMNAMAQVPYPANIAAAAMVAAKGAMQLAQIKKTNIGGAGSVAGAGGGGASPSGVTSSVPSGTQKATDESKERSAVQVVFNGPVVETESTARWLAEIIRDAADNRDMVFFSSNSRQAMELGA